VNFGFNSIPAAVDSSRQGLEVVLNSIPQLAELLSQIRSRLELYESACEANDLEEERSELDLRITGVKDCEHRRFI